MAEGPVLRPALSVSALRPTGKAPARTIVAVLGTTVLCTLALGLNAAMDSPRTLMSRDDYALGRRAVEAATRLALGHCRALAGNARLVCRAEAHAHDRVARAELEAHYYGTVDAAAAAKAAQSRARIEIARAHCSERSGATRFDCLSAARLEKKDAPDRRLAAS